MVHRAPAENGGIKHDGGFNKGAGKPSSLKKIDHVTLW